MRKFVILLIVILLLVLAGGAMAFLLNRKEAAEWTSSSPEAIAELEKGLDAEMKLYGREAQQHYQRALELDPGFVAARLAAGGHLVAREMGRLKGIDELLKETHAARLNDRERFLVEVARAGQEGDEQARRKAVDAYLERHPGDPFALNLRCGRAWAEVRWAEAERCYSSLIEQDPNWVLAQNNLGYIALAQGRFDDAEKRFRTYLYVAPDQSNPHDSLGELLLLRGRYDEAEKHFQDALSLRSDFCASWQHLVLVELMRGRFDAAKNVVERAKAADGCPSGTLELESTRIEVYEAMGKRDWNGVVAAGLPIAGKVGDVSVLVHRAALLSGQMETAEAIEQRAREIEKKSASNERMKAGAESMVDHLEGSRLAVEGRTNEAIEKFREADAKMFYWGNGEGVFKLYNRMLLVDTLSRAGESVLAKKLRAEVDAVNPNLASFGMDAE